MRSAFNIPKLLIIIFVSCIAGLILYGYLIKKQVQQKGTVSVGKYTSHSNLGKHESNTFTYYIAGVKKQADGGKVPGGFEKNVGKFYEIKYSTGIPNIIIADYGKEITDKNTIQAAGFNLEDL